MSRSALWRQEAHVKERERQAQDVFSTAVEEGRVSAFHCHLLTLQTHTHRRTLARLNSRATAPVASFPCTGQTTPST